MAGDYLHIQGGDIYDPASSRCGVRADIWIAGGKIVEAPKAEEVRAKTTLNASGLIVMPGGVDMHCHIAGPKVNAGRLLQATRDPCRAPFVAGADAGSWLTSGVRGAVPSSHMTGYQYAGLGYTSAVDAAITPLAARHVHEEFRDTPCINKTCLLIASDHLKVLEAVAADDHDLLKDVLAWLLQSCKAWGIKAVNPGGVEAWKSRAHPAVASLDDHVPGYGVSPRQILMGMARAVDALNLPHPLHIHCNQLGMPGNAHTTLRSMEALEGRRGHFTHIQFHSYGGAGLDENSFQSAAPTLVDYVRTHPNISVDVGQIVFDKTVALTGDSAAGHYLQKMFGTPWYSVDVEVESGCGVSPIEYRETSLVHSWQWAIGLEWFLLMDDPWRIALSTDHPNGGSFAAYPRIIKLLMDRDYRQAMLEKIHPKVREQSNLAHLTREYTLEEIAIITRASPAKLLGFTNKGTLRPGADADVSIYSPNVDIEAMFSVPSYVVQSGEVIVKHGELLKAHPGATFSAKLDMTLDKARIAQLKAWFERTYSIAWNNFPVGNDLLDAVSN